MQQINNHHKLDKITIKRYKEEMLRQTSNRLLTGTEITTYTKTTMYIPIHKITNETLHVECLLTVKGRLRQVFLQESPRTIHEIGKPDERGKLKQNNDVSTREFEPKTYMFSQKKKQKEKSFGNNPGNSFFS